MRKTKSSSKRSIHVGIRFHPPDHSKIHLAAKKRNMSFNSFVCFVAALAAEKVLQAPAAAEELREMLEVQE